MTAAEQLSLLGPKGKGEGKLWSLEGESRIAGAVRGAMSRVARGQSKATSPSSPTFGPPARLPFD